MRRALIADDEPLLQALMNDVLTGLGYAVDIVGTGRAVYLLSGMQYDLIILDVNMPEWNGVEGFEMSRAFGNKSPVLFVTGDCNVEVPNDVPVLHKPFSVSEFEEAVRRVAGG